MSQAALRLPDTWWHGCRLKEAMYRARRPLSRQTQQTPPFSTSSNEKRAVLSTLKLPPPHRETAHQDGLPGVPGRRARKRERELIHHVAEYLSMYPDPAKKKK